MLKDDALTLRQAGIQDGTKLMLVGSKASDVLAVTSAKPSAIAASVKLANGTPALPLRARIRRTHTLRTRTRRAHTLRMRFRRTRTRRTRTLRTPNVLTRPLMPAPDVAQWPH